MADGVAITPGSGETVATDQVTGITPTLTGTSQAQYVKLVDGTVDSVNKGLIGSNGAQSVMLAVDGLSSAGVLLTPKRAFINAASGSTNTTVVAAVAGKKIRVLQFVVTVGSAANTVIFTTLTAGTAISPTIASDVYGGLALSFSPMGYFESATGEGLGVTTSASGQTTGILVGYVEV